MHYLRWILILAILCPAFVLTAQIDNRKAAFIEMDSCSNWLRVSGVDLNQLDQDRDTWFLIYQAGGASMEVTNGDNYGRLTERNGAGDFEVNRISAVSGDTIFPAFQLRRTYGNVDMLHSPALYLQTDLTGETINTYLPDAPDELLFLPASGALRIATDLNLDGLGYGGGQGSVRDSECGALTNANDFFYSSSDWRGAAKGTAPYRFLQQQNRENGRGARLSGGGGGNDHNSGGGGGGHLSAGGNGAQNEEPGFFNCDGNFPGLGGYGLPSGTDTLPLLWLGGGGGAGHANNTDASDGGNGGGIILVYAGSLHFDGNPTLSVAGTDGQSVVGDGAGGGGAGGSIFLLADEISGTAILNAPGGDGGSVDNSGQNRCFGPGGGGAGGRILSRAPLPFEITMNVQGGLGGDSENGTACSPGENRGINGNAGTSEIGDFQPKSANDALELAEEFYYPFLPCPGEEIQFGYPSLSSCFAYRWYLIEGDTETELSEGAVYSTVNTPELTIRAVPPADSLVYQLRLVNSGGGTVATTDFIVFVDALPTADFDYTLTDGMLSITGNNSLFADDFRWLFGDGTESTEVLPTHTYGQSGDYSLSLIVNNGCGSDTLTREISVSIATVAVANFTFADSSICLGDTLFIANNSQNATALEWNLEPAGPSLEPDPSAGDLYLVPTAVGGYALRLIVTGPGEDNRDTLTRNFTVTEPADFTVSWSQSANTYELTATGGGSDTPFFILPSGDTLFGTTHSVDLPPPGDYSVIFVAPNDVCGEYRETVAFTVTVPLVVELRAPLLVGCRPLTAWFVNESSGPIESIAWEYPQGLTGITALTTNEDSLVLRFDTVGLFPVRLLVTGPEGTVAREVTVEIVTPPLPLFSVAESEGRIELTNTTVNASVFSWNFGDGNGSTEFAPTHQYDSPGTYEITLNAGNGICSRATSQVIAAGTISGVEDPVFSSVRLYPNPAGERVFLAGPVGMRYQLYDVLGRSVGPVGEVGSDPVEINMSDRAAGSYWVRMFFREKWTYRQLIVK